MCARGVTMEIHFNYLEFKRFGAIVAHEYYISGEITWHLWYKQNYFITGC